MDRSYEVVGILDSNGDLLHRRERHHRTEEPDDVTRAPWAAVPGDPAARRQPGAQGARTDRPVPWAEGERDAGGEAELSAPVILITWTKAPHVA